MEFAIYVLAAVIAGTGVGVIISLTTIAMAIQNK
jgi:hypothetical protein